MKKPAFSIVELIVAAAVFASSLLILLGVFPVSARAIRSAQHRLIATQLAQDRLDLDRAQAYGTVLNRFYTPDEPVVNSALLVHNDQREIIEFTVAERVDPVPGSPGLLNVRADVTWKADGRDQSLFLETQIALPAP